jgi:thiol-disulfide isomerase/thioredoxin
MRKHLLSLLACFTCFSYTAVLASQTGPTIGSIAPDFKARNLLTGEVTPLNSQRGKIVILTFWASWCAPCRRELPILERAQMVIGKDRLTVFAVSYRESPDAESRLKRVASAWHINMIEDSNGWIAGHYGISSIPHLFLIDREGKVVANHLGYGDRSLAELVADINHALAESTPAEQEAPPPPPPVDSAS